eukprot:5880547-Prymnesium_polylepis.2
MEWLSLALVATHGVDGAWPVSCKRLCAHARIRGMMALYHCRKTAGWKRCTNGAACAARVVFDRVTLDRGRSHCRNAEAIRLPGSLMVVTYRTRNVYGRSWIGRHEPKRLDLSMSSGERP